MRRFLAVALLLVTVLVHRPADTAPAAEGPSARGRLVARTSRFVFRASPGAEGVARHLARSAEEIRDRLAQDLGEDYDGITEVRIGHDTASFRALMPPGRKAPTWAAGVAYPDLDLIVLDGRGAPRSASLEQVLAHEVSHIALGRLAPGRFPRFFLEGIATYHAGEWDLGRVALLSGAVTRDELIPLSDLVRGWPDHPQEVRLAYAESIAFVSWFFGTYGRPAMHRLIRGVVAGAPFEAALEAATGEPLWKLEIAWHDALRLRYTWVPAVASTGFFWGLISLLFLYAWWHRRRGARRRLAEMEAEESLLAEAAAGDLPPLEASEERISAADPGGPPLLH